MIAITRAEIEVLIVKALKNNQWIHALRDDGRACSGYSPEMIRINQEAAIDLIYAGKHERLELAADDGLDEILAKVNAS